MFTTNSKSNNYRFRISEHFHVQDTPGSFHYDIVWERASHLPILMHLLIFVCLWVNVTLTAYYVNNLNGLRNML